MLPKSKRIPREAFSPLLTSRSFMHSTHFTLRFAPSGTPRAAVSVSKKVSKSAVVRNTIRRRVYSVLRDTLPVRGTYLFVAKTGSGEVRGEALCREVTELLNEAQKRYNS